MLHEFLVVRLELPHGCDGLSRRSGLASGQGNGGSRHRGEEERGRGSDFWSSMRVGQSAGTPLPHIFSSLFSPGVRRGAAASRDAERAAKETDKNLAHATFVRRSEPRPSDSNAPGDWTTDLVSQHRATPRQGDQRREETNLVDSWMTAIASATISSTICLAGVISLTMAAT